MIRINEIKMPLDHSPADLKERVSRILKTNDIRCLSIAKKSVDARDKDNIRFIYGVNTELANEQKYIHIKNVSLIQQIKYKSPKVSDTIQKPPVVIGSGPAGLFAALILAEAGCCPIVLERGKAAEERKKDVDVFWTTGRLELESNALFGEGGAGTFSDGKLTTGIKDIRISKVLDTFIEAGAPEEIKYLAKPHIGTDKLLPVIQKIRQRIISLGGIFYFGAKFTGFHQQNNKLDCVFYETSNGSFEIETDQLILAIGHSARDTIQMLYDNGVVMEAKPFAVGVRIEHSRMQINHAMYGKYAEHPALGAADYKYSTHLRNGHSVYTFCMCPGGQVVAAASEEGGLAVNGMSYYNRNMDNSNSALLVSVNPGDYGDRHPLSGIAFQRRLESRAFEVGGGRFTAPAQLVGDFLQRRETRDFGQVEPSYLPAVRAASLDECLDGIITDSLRMGIQAFDKNMKGFASYDAVLTAVESRSSSPVRIQRGDNCQSNIVGITPCGEGAGYAGGIMSAAVDGIRCAEYICEAL